MFYAVSIMSLGYTRINGVVAFNNATYEFLEITPAVAKKLINNGQMKGLLWKNSEHGVEFVCDKEGFNQQNIVVKTACGKFRPLYDDYPGNINNCTCSVVRVFEKGEERQYEVVSNTCFRVKMSEEDLRGLAKVVYIAGVVITADDIKVCDGVVIQKNATEESLEAIPENVIHDLTNSITERADKQTTKNVEEVKESLEETSENEDTEPDENEDFLDEEDDTFQESLVDQNDAEMDDEIEEDDKASKKKTMFDIFKK